MIFWAAVTAKLPEIVQVAAPAEIVQVPPLAAWLISRLTVNTSPDGTFAPAPVNVNVALVIVPVEATDVTSHVPITVFEQLVESDTYRVVAPYSAELALPAKLAVVSATPVFPS
jgi:hypothetical protein